MEEDRSFNFPGHKVIHSVTESSLNTYYVPDSDGGTTRCLGYTSGNRRRLLSFRADLLAAVDRQ